ncbi:MAG: M24 family metallopeptidase [Isosphaeraceae bacterium]
MHSLDPLACATRRKRLWDALPKPCDALILGDPQSLIYFANHAPSPFVFRTSDAAALLVLTPDRATLVADAMVKGYAAEAHVDDRVLPVWYDGKHSAPHRRALLLKTALEVVGARQATRWGAESSVVPLGMASALGEPLAIDTIVRGLRRRKDPDEVALIRASARAGEAGHRAALAGIHSGMTELDAYRVVQNASIWNAGEPVIVYGDFASGPRCVTDRGGPPTQRMIEPGDLFLLDYSVVIRGYRADFTNTFVVDGGPTASQKTLFDACLAALAAGESVLKPGVLAREVDRSVRAALAERGLEHAFPSHSGHGLGLSHPEPPYLVAESDDTLLEGDVVALEPGLFVPEVGGMRFERNYLITRDGFECLTHHRLTLER